MFLCVTFEICEASQIRRARRKLSQRSQINYRINRQIRSREVQLIDAENTNHGTVTIQRAIELAAEAGLDLVEVAPNANPPVCRILDYGKFAYEKTRKEREARKNQKKVETKNINMKLKISDFHRDIRIKNARRWLNQGKKVRVAVKFHGREIQYPELGRELIEKFGEELEDVAVVEVQPNMEGRSMVMLLAPEDSSTS